MIQLTRTDDSRNARALSLLRDCQRRFDSVTIGWYAMLPGCIGGHKLGAFLGGTKSATAWSGR